jgi:hypothetical protein
MNGPEHVAGLGGCSRCGARAQVRDVTFHQHIGLIVVFIHRRVGGRLCQRCATDAFREALLITAAFGWWGVISFFATPVTLVLDVVAYLLVRRRFADPSATTASGTDTLLAVLAGVGLLGCCVCTVPYLGLLALGSGLRALSGPADDGPSSSTASPCSGGADPDAAPFVPGAPAAIAYGSADGRWAYDRAYLPEAWQSDAPTVAVCVDAATPIVVERCEVPGGTIVRTAYARHVRAVELRTGRELATWDVEAPEGPAPCEAGETASRSTVTRSGARVQPDDVRAALLARPL